MMKRSVLLAVVVTFALIAAGCGDDDGGGDGASTTAASGDTTEETAPPPSSIDPDDLEVEVFGEGAASITLDNGEVFEGGVACSLEETVEGGQSVLFSAVSPDGSISVSQYGSEGEITDIGVTTVADPDTLETLWTSDGTWSLTLDGTTINGAGGFVSATDEVVDGTVEVIC